MLSFIPTVTALLLLALNGSLAVSIPAEASNWLQPRAPTNIIDLAPNASCPALLGRPARTYSQEAIKAAVMAGMSFVTSGKRVKASGSKKYPHQFGNREGFDMGDTCNRRPNDRFEWPILPDGKIFNATTHPGIDRVIFSRYPQGKEITLCNVVRHRADGAFVQCS